MLVGIAGFLLAALVVNIYQPGLGLRHGLGWLPPIVYVALFSTLQARLAAHGRALIEAVEKGEPKELRNRPFLLVLLQVLFFALVLHLGWSEFVQVDLGLGSTWLLPALLMIAPYLLVHVSWLTARHEIYEAPRREPWPRASYVLFHLRVLLIPGLVCALVSGFGWLATDPTIGPYFVMFPSLQLIGVLISSIVFLSLAPLILRLGLRSRPLPEGPLRAEFEAVAERADFKFLDIRVAETEGRINNALFVGILGRLRYVFVTDGLIKRFGKEDLRGVFAHEMAHSKRGHLLFNLALMLGMTLMLHLFSLGDQPGGDGLLSAMMGLLFLPIFLIFVFAPINRSWETEADVYSGEILGDPGPIKRALTLLGDLNPTKKKGGGFTHPAVEARTAFLDAYFREPAVAAAFRARIKRLRFWVLIFFFVPAASWLLTLGDEYQLGRIDYAISQADEYEDLSLAEDAEKRLAPLLERPDFDSDFRYRARLWTTLAMIHEKNESLDKAEPYVDLLESNVDQMSSPFAPYNTAVLAAQLSAGRGDLAGMLGPLRRAELELEPITELGGDDPQFREEVERERRDLRFMRGLERLGRLNGQLPPAVLGPPAPWADDPYHRALEEALKLTEEGTFSAAEARRLTASLSPDWKRIAILSLSP